MRPDGIGRNRREFDPWPFLDLLAAQPQGETEGLTRPALSRFLVDQVVLPDLFANLEHKVVRTQHFLCWGLAGLAGAALLLGLMVRQCHKAV